MCQRIRQLYVIFTFQGKSRYWILMESMKNMLILLVILLSFECIESYEWGYPNYGAGYHGRRGPYGLHNGYGPYGQRRWVAELVHRMVHLDLHLQDRSDSYFTVRNLIILSDYLWSNLSFIFLTLSFIFLSKIEFLKRLHNEKLYGNFSIIDIIWIIRIIFLNDLISYSNDRISNINTITSWR
ncbi:unnamed protein product [Brugia pahangi]|uniref:G_PROTEIN_RECEP_F1_2 domain-containing protein n=1 Tax=Brugia pahangi TaxID=6280 RepID=A0A0N4T956_BRUPA|nr:unnamed protein product [Brugia pahangi]